MKKTVFISIMVLMICICGIATASSGKCGRTVTWVLDDEGTLTISGTGQVNNGNSFTREIRPSWETSEAIIKKVIVSEGVTSIPGESFINNKNLQTVELPSSIEEIGEHAFSQCSSLQTINFPEGLQTIRSGAFWYCKSIVEVRLPSSLQTVGSVIFASCDSLKTVFSASNMGTGMFEGCTNLEVVQWEDGITSIPASAFSYCSSLKHMKIPETVTSIAAYAFHKSSLETVTIPSAVKEIGKLAFGSTPLYRIEFLGDQISITSEIFDSDPLVYCYKDTGVDEWAIQNKCTIFYLNEEMSTPTPDDPLIPDPSITPASGTCGRSLTWDLNSSGVLTIKGSGEMYDYENGRRVEDPSSIPYDQRRNAPWKATDVRSIVIYDGVQKIGMGAFALCKQCTSAIIPSSVTEIGSYAFSGCSSLQNVILRSSIRKIGAYAFRGCSALENLVLPEYITEISTGAFSSCGSLQSVVIPSMVTKIGDDAFSGCTALHSIVWPNRLTSIGNFAFALCTSLEEFSVPRTVSSIGKNAFQSCTNLKSIDLGQTHISSLGVMMFHECEKLTSVILPSSLTVIESNAFSYCSELREIILPDGISDINEEAFYACTKLEKVTLPKNAQILRDYAFADCSSLTDVEMPPHMFELGKACFNNCAKLTHITIPESVCYIRYAAFARCSSLENVEIEGDPLIESGAFVYTKIKTIDLNPLVSLGGEAFPKTTIIRCYKHSQVDEWATKHGQPVEYIRDGMLAEGTIKGNDGDITWTLDLTGMLSISGSGTMPDKPIWRLYNRFIMQAEISEGITNLSQYAFSGCKNLISVSIPESLSSIDEHAFDDCTLLWTLQLGNSIKAIDLSTLPTNIKLMVPYNSETEALLKQKSYESYYYIPFTPDSITAVIQNSIHIQKTGQIHIYSDIAEIELSKFLIPQFVFSSEDNNIATVSEKGIVKGIKEGKTSIIISDKDDPFVNAMISVEVVDHRAGSLAPFISSNYADLSGKAKLTYGCEGGTPPYFVTLEIGGIIQDLENHKVLKPFPETLRIIENENVAAGEELTYYFSVPANDGKHLSAYVASMKVKDAVGNESQATIDFGITYDYGPLFGDQMKYFQVYDNAADYRTGRIHSISVPKAMTMEAGESQLLDLSCNPSASVGVGQKQEHIVFMSEDPEIADIGEDGLITAYQAGSTIIHTYTIDGSGLHEETKLDIVNKYVRAITVTASEIVRGQQTLSVSIQPEDASDQTVSWSTSNSAIATIDENGVLTWHAKGDVSVTASALDGSGVQGSIDLHFEGILIEKLVIGLSADDNRQLVWHVFPEYATDQTLTFQVNNPSVLQVSSDGKLTFIKQGSAVIRAKTNDGSGIIVNFEISDTDKHVHVPGERSYLLATQQDNGILSDVRCALCEEIMQAEDVIFSDRCIFMPDTTETIAEESFAGLLKVQQIWIPDGTVDIGDKAFADCFSLLLVRIPESVVNIGPNVFDNDENVCIVSPAGSFAADYAQSKGIYWIDEELVLLND